MECEAFDHGGSGSGEPTAQELSPAQRPLALTATSPVNRYDFSSGALTLPGLHVVLSDASNTAQTSCYDASLRTQSAEPLVLELVGAPSTPCTSSATALGNYIGATGLLTLPGMTAARSTGSSCYDVVMRKTSDNPIRLALVSALSATCAGEVTLAGTSSTAGVACGISRNVYNADPSVLANSNASWSCGSARVLAGNGIPDHVVGSFPNANNPNAITAQAVSASYSLTPAITNPSGSASMVAGHALNGVKFDPGTAGTCTDAGNCSAIGGGGAWSLEAINSGFKFGTDSSNAHVQPNGQYHHHGMPEGLLDRLGKGAAMTLVGWAVDGFPVNARYGYADASNARWAIKVLA